MYLWFVELLWLQWCSRVGSKSASYMPFAYPLQDIFSFHKFNVNRFCWINESFCELYLLMHDVIICWRNKFFLWISWKIKKPTCRTASCTFSSWESISIKPLIICGLTLSRYPRATISSNAKIKLNAFSAIPISSTEWLYSGICNVKLLKS